MHIAISDTILGLHRTTIKKLSTGCEGAARWKHKALFQRTLGVFLLSSWIWYPLPKAGCHATVEDIQCSLLQNAGLCQLLWRLHDPGLRGCWGTWRWGELGVCHTEWWGYGITTDKRMRRHQCSAWDVEQPEAGTQLEKEFLTFRSQILEEQISTVSILVSLPQTT